jgi:hypothetical protein
MQLGPHNYELFEIAKILTLRTIDKPSAVKTPKLTANFTCIKAAGWIGHEFIAMATSNSKYISLRGNLDPRTNDRWSHIYTGNVADFIILRYVGSSGVPLVKQFEWFKGDKTTIIDMSWCPDAHHLLILTADMTLILVPAANLVIGGKNSQKTSQTHSGASLTARRLLRADPKVSFILSIFWCYSYEPRAMEFILELIVCLGKNRSTLTFRSLWWFDHHCSSHQNHQGSWQRTCFLVENSRKIGLLHQCFRKGNRPICKSSHARG